MSGDGMSRVEALTQHMAGPLWDMVGLGVFPLRPAARLEERLKRHREEILVANHMLGRNFNRPVEVAEHVGPVEALRILSALDRVPGPLHESSFRSLE